MKAAVAAIAIGAVALFVVLALRHVVAAAFTLASGRGGEFDDPDMQRLHLEDARDAALRNLREVHFDYETGKIDERDFRELRARYEGRAVAAMRELESQEPSA